MRLRKLTALLLSAAMSVTAFASLTLTASAVGTELVEQSGMEGINSVTNIPWWWGAHNNASVQATTEEFHEGAHSLAVTDRKDYDQGAEQNIQSRIKAGGEYSASLYIKLPADSTETTFKLIYYAWGGTPYEAISGTAKAGVWTKIEGKFVASVTANVICLETTETKASEGGTKFTDYYLDDVSIIETSDLLFSESFNIENYTGDVSMYVANDGSSFAEGATPTDAPDATPEPNPAVLWNHLQAKYGNGWNENNGIKIDVTDKVQGHSGDLFTASVVLGSWYWNNHDAVLKFDIVSGDSHNEIEVAKGMPTEGDTVTLTGTKKLTFTDSDKVYLIMTHPSGDHWYDDIYIRCEEDSAEPTATPEPSTEPEVSDFAKLPLHDASFAKDSTPPPYYTTESTDSEAGLMIGDNGWLQYKNDKSDDSYNTEDKDHNIITINIDGQDVSAGDTLHVEFDYSNSNYATPQGISVYAENYEIGKIEPFSGKKNEVVETFSANITVPEFGSNGLQIGLKITGKTNPRIKNIHIYKPVEVGAGVEKVEDNFSEMTEVPAYYSLKYSGADSAKLEVKDKQLGTGLGTASIPNGDGIFVNLTDEKNKGKDYNINFRFTNGNGYSIGAVRVIEEVDGVLGNTIGESRGVSGSINGGGHNDTFSVDFKIPEYNNSYRLLLAAYAYNPKDGAKDGINGTGAQAPRFDFINIVPKENVTFYNLAEYLRNEDNSADMRFITSVETADETAVIDKCGFWLVDIDNLNGGMQYPLIGIDDEDRTHEASFWHDLHVADVSKATKSEVYAIPFVQIKNAIQSGSPFRYKGAINTPVGEVQTGAENTEEYSAQ